MKVITPDPLALVYSVVPSLPWTDRPGPVLCLGLLAAFPLDRPDARGLDDLACVDDLWQAVDEDMPEGDALDAGLPKPRSEFLVYGAACSPRPVPALEVGVQVGDLAKRLKVFGDRLLARDKPLEPEPFTRMDVSWANAFGGQGHEYNPGGKGFAPAPDGARPRPNVEGPDRTDPGDPQQEPAGLTAVPVTWPQRQALMGRPDGAWLKTHWPGLPKGTDPDFACVAPPDQRFPGFLEGGEPVVIRNMHPAKPVLRGGVPRLRGRLFIQRESSAGGEFAEIPCRMETLWLFPDHELGVVLFRGLAPVRDEECEDVAAVLAAAEDASQEPAPAEAYIDQCRKALGPVEPPRPQAPAASKPPPMAGDPMRRPDASLLAAGVATAGGLAAMAEPMVDQDIDSPLADLVDSLESRLEETLKDLDTDQDEVEQWLEERVLHHEHADPESAAVESGPAEDPQQALQDLVDEIEGQTREIQDRTGMTEADVQQWLEEQQTSLPGPEDHIARLQDLAESPGLAEDTRAEIAKAVAAFTALGAAMAGLAAMKDKKSAKRSGGPPGQETSDTPPPAPGKPLSTEQALQQLQETGSLAHCDLTECEFAGRDLSDADLRGCLMSGVDWTGADLAGADLREAVAHEASLQGARLDNARLDEADFEKASLAGASAKNCSGAKAGFQQANLQAIDLSQASAPDADLRGADLRGANCRGLAAPGLRLQEADVSQAVFQDADLAGSRADGQTAAPGADFRRANLKDACWSGASLGGTRFDQARLDRADLSKTDLGQASLLLAQAPGAVLDKASLRGADLTGCNLFQASLRRADCAEAVVRDANLFGADLYECAMDADKLKDVNIGRTCLEHKLAEAPGG